MQRATGCEEGSPRRQEQMKAEGSGVEGRGTKRSGHNDEDKRARGRGRQGFLREEADLEKKRNGRRREKETEERRGVEELDEPKGR